MENQCPFKATKICVQSQQCRSNPKQCEYIDVMDEIAQQSKQMQKYKDQSNAEYRLEKLSNIQLNIDVINQKISHNLRRLEILTDELGITDELYQDVNSL